MDIIAPIIRVFLEYGIIVIQRRAVAARLKVKGHKEQSLIGPYLIQPDCDNLSACQTMIFCNSCKSKQGAIVKYSAPGGKGSFHIY